MDRTIVYGTAVPRSIDLLSTGQSAMVGLAKIAASMLGTGPFVDEFTCTATAPASLTVNLGPGQIYQQQALEATAVSALPADTHIILKQGVLLDPTALTFVPPTTLGQAVNALIQVQYVDVDSNPIVLPYNNPANPKQPFSGPGNNNQAQNTVRKGGIAISQKYGAAATAGTQSTPTPDSGWVGLFVVTLTYNQTTITSGNIATYVNAPFIGAKLGQIPQAVQANTWTFANDAGSSGLTIAANLSPPPGTVSDGFSVLVKLARDLQPGAIFTLNGGNTGTITRQGGTPFGPQDYLAGGVVQLIRNASFWVIGGSSSAVDVIDTPLTRTVYGAGADFADLQTAFAWISRRRITSTGLVTLQLPIAKGASKIVSTTDIYFSHPDGERVLIVGQPLTQAVPAPAAFTITGNTGQARVTDTAAALISLRASYQTEITFSGGHGLYITGNLGSLQDILLTADGQGASKDVFLNENGLVSLTRVWAAGGSGRGLAAGNTAYLKMFGNCGAVGCGGDGVAASLNGTIIIPAGVVVSMSNGARGIRASYASQIVAAAASTLAARGNGTDGFSAELGSGLYASVSSSADTNAAAGFRCSFQGWVQAYGTQSTGNQDGYFCEQSSHIDATNTTGANSRYGYYASSISDIYRTGGTVTGTTAAASPAVGGTPGNVGAVIY